MESPAQAALSSVLTWITRAVVVVALLVLLSTWTQAQSPSTCRVVIIAKDSRVTYGSGVYLGRDKNQCSLVLTSYHVVDGQEDSMIVVQFPHHDDSAYIVDGIDVPEKRDLAILAFKQEITAPCRQLRRQSPQKGERLFAEGHGFDAPRSKWMAVADSEYMANQDIKGYKSLTFCLTGPSRPGDSGGPVCDGHGRLVGILFATNPTKTFVTPITEWPELFESIPALDRSILVNK